MPLFKNAATFNIFIFVYLCYVVNGDNECEIGTCVEVRDCPSALHAIHARGDHNLERCGWNKLSEKVCCLDAATTTTIITDTGISISSGEDTDITTTTPVITTSTQSNVVRGNVRKSEEACQQYSKNAPFQINNHILGGEVASAGEFPHMAALGYRAEDGGTELRYICGGSILTDRYILTAAHCLNRRQPVRVLVGVLNITEQSSFRREYNIDNITIHPEFRRQSNDIALIRTVETIEFNTNLYPACLYQQNDDPLGLIITGWGRTAVGQDVFSDILLKARVAAVPLATCNTTYIRINRPLSDGQICAGSTDPSMEADSCPGDSGGPMQVLAKDNLMYEIVGVVSFGLTDCGGQAPSVYTRVYQYLDWIEPIVWP